MIDKISALAVPPGNSLTDAPGKWPWEQPARFSDPDDVIDYTIDTISNGQARGDMIKMMMAGISVEEIVEQLTFKGFMAGAFTPDVAEIIKPALGIFLADLALQEGFEPQMFVDASPVEGEMTDATFIKIMKDRNPELFMAMNEEINKEQRMKDKEVRQTKVSYASVPSNSFLDTPAEEQQDV